MPHEVFIKTPSAFNSELRYEGGLSFTILKIYSEVLFSFECELVFYIPVCLVNTISFILIHTTFIKVKRKICLSINTNLRKFL